MNDALGLAQRAQDALEVIEPTLLYIQHQALKGLLTIAPDQRDLIDRAIAKAQVVDEVIAALKRTIAAGEMEKARRALDDQGITAR
jgi:hypothetical protein